MKVVAVTSCATGIAHTYMAHGGRGDSKDL